MLQTVSQLYARVFTQILDSSIAEDYVVRHVFEDFLKLCDHKTGVVDMTRQVMARRLNIPLDVLSGAIDKLESPDASSRDKSNDGRRIERLDDHRDWGWRILNWDKYEKIRNRADLAMRVAKHREKSASQPSPEQAEQIYEAYPRKVGKPKAIAAIQKSLEKTEFKELLLKTQLYAKSRASEDSSYTPNPSTWFNQERYNDEPSTWKQSKPSPQRVDRSIGTTNEGRASEYEGLGRLAKP